ncbi:MAG TPA: hypothetical protein GYA07_03495 [Verrucomicrobia bacterium]|nr:hypothetical protein [Verrucomicrobiota bacterium]HOB32548.1 hypothetical protein [Verrucomicrobiota bacterium]HOP96652.1 hypothetical protein [Verrucomicrobiota bacterium]HPU57492.1 hypothetical protein [Verrucomicrobiota bacterium]
MRLEDTIGYKNNVAACVVCGKNVQNGGGFARVPRGTMLLELCCPLCLKTFQADPEPYVRRVQRAEYFRELAALQEQVGMQS